MNGITWNFGKLPCNTYDTEIYLFAMGTLTPVCIPAKTDTNKRKRHKFFNLVAPCKIQDKYFYSTVNRNQIDFSDIKDVYKDAIVWASNNIKNVDAVSFITGMLSDWIIEADEIENERDW